MGKKQCSPHIWDEEVPNPLVKTKDTSTRPQRDQAESSPAKQGGWPLSRARTSSTSKCPKPLPAESWGCGQIHDDFYYERQTIDVGLYFSRKMHRCMLYFTLRARWQPPPEASMQYPPALLLGYHIRISFRSQKRKKMVGFISLGSGELPRTRCPWKMKIMSWQWTYIGGEMWN